MKYIPAGVSSKVARFALKTQKHSPTILFVAGVGGAVTSTVLACKATLRLEEVLDETARNLNDAAVLREQRPELYSEKDLQKDKAYVYVRGVVSVAKLYAPAIIIGSLSVAALTGSHNILNKRNAGLTAAYATLEKGFNDYKQRVEEELGVEKSQELMHGVEEHTVKDDEGKKVKIKLPKNASMYARWFNDSNDNWQPTGIYNLHWLYNKQDWANDRLRIRGHVMLSEVYDDLGIPRTPESLVVGWLKGEGNFIDFGLTNVEENNFIEGRHRGNGVLLDFNVDGTIWDKI